MNYPLSGGSSRPRSGHILVCLACLGLIIAARAKQQQPAFGLPVRPTNPPLRCRDVRWCVQLGLCCSPAQGCSGGRMGQLQSLFLSTRSSWLAAIGHDDSSHMRAHRTVQPPPPTRGLQRRSPQPSSFCKRLIAGHRLRRRACMHSRCPVCADCRYTDACVKSIFSWMAEVEGRGTSSSSCLVA